VITAVLFDFYGTLARATSWGPRYEDVLAAHGVSLPDAVRERWVSDAFDGCEHLEHSVSRERYVAWEKARLARMLADCGVGPREAAPLVEELWRAGKSFTMAAYPEVPGVLAALRAAGVAVGVCSNWDWDLDAALASAGLDGLVDAAVTSARAGARKPHPRIFREALAALGEPEPATVLFVGDSWHADVAGPLAVGMRAVHLVRPGDARPAPPLPPGVRRAADLADAAAEALDGHRT
jgi:putative hydrolase of the HAD superfamily